MSCHWCFGVHFDLFGYGDCEQGASRSGDKIGATHNGHSGQFLWPQFCHPNSEAPIIARKAIPKLTEMDKLPVLNTSDDFPVDISDTEIIFRFAYILN